MPIDNTAPATAQEDTTGDLFEQEDVTLRDTLDAAFEAAATNEQGSEAAAEQRARDERGRFAPATPAAADPAAPLGAAPAAAGAAPAAAPAVEPIKAPAAWRPEVREQWAKVPQSIQAEVARRERDYQLTMQQAAGQRQFVDAFEQAVRPYEVFIRQENSNPIQAMTNMFQTAATLRVGTPMEKAKIACDIVKNFGIDIEVLDRMLAGAPVQGVPQQQMLQYRDPRVDQMLAIQHQRAVEQDHFENQSIARGLQKFAATHEFYSDVSDTMADLVERASKRGETVNLEKIYARACQLDGSVSTILAQRSAATRQGQNSQAVLRARRAASSPRSEPTPDGATVPKDDSVRAAVEAAFEASASR